MIDKITKLIIYFAYFLEDLQRYREIKSFFYNILNGEKSKLKIIFDSFMVILVLISIFILIYDVKNTLNPFWYSFENFVLIVFLIEYLLRLWVYNDIRTIVIEHNEKSNYTNEKFSLKELFKEIFSKKLEYITSPLAIIDLLALLPSFRGFRILRIFLLFRLFKLFRYARSINEFVKVLADKKFELFTLTFLVSFVVFASATAIYIFEADLKNSEIETFFDAIYWSFVTISTVGYGDISPVTSEGRVVTLILIISGIGVISFSTSIVASAFSEKLTELKANRIKTEVDRIDDFIIICGFGKVGEIVAQKLAKSKDKFIVIDKDEKNANLAKQLGYITIEADAKYSDILLEAGVGSGARKILCLTDDEVSNIYITLSAKNIDKDIEVISRVNKKSSEKKFLLAGANRVIYPFEISALVASEYVGEPVAFEAIYGIVSESKYRTLLDDIEIKRDSFLQNRAIKDIDFKYYKLILFGVVRTNIEGYFDFEQSFELDKKHFIFNPKEDFILKEGDFLITLGKDVSISHFRKEIEKSILNV